MQEWLGKCRGDSWGVGQPRRTPSRAGRALMAQGPVPAEGRGSRKQPPHGGAQRRGEQTPRSPRSQPPGSFTGNGVGTSRPCRSRFSCRGDDQSVQRLDKQTGEANTGGRVCERSAGKGHAVSQTQMQSKKIATHLSAKKSPKKPPAKYPPDFCMEKIRKIKRQINQKKIFDIFILSKRSNTKKF